MNSTKSATLSHPDSLFNNYGTRNLSMVRGEGVFLYDDTGARYLDFTAGIAVCNLGHAHIGLAQVIAQQVQTLMHTSNLFLIPGQVALADKLAGIAGLAEDAKVLFVNSGTEANEAALKLARKYHAAVAQTNRTKVLSLPGAFHGRTMGALSLTPKAAYHNGFTPLVPDCLTPNSLDEVLASIDTDVAACIVEVVQGEKGVYPLEAQYLQELSKRLREVGALLIVDEVQTGVGRTGTFFAYEQVGIQPDIVTLAKGLGNGFPVGAVIARESVAAAFTPGAHGTTFGGSPLAMAVGNYVFDTVTETGFLEGVNRVGKALEQVLSGHFEHVSGRGLMWGFDVADAASFTSRAADCGLLVTKCSDTRIRVVPPLILEESHVQMFEKIVQEII
ncbi:aspartate aminotransferase family protein [Alicyclobacillus fastidiosus]|uniref:Acetylornithine/succinylornithine family transaminase n=1 Tax=Alicyclobacillus fastidiosus TaxID=392011 RepID=A0ABV5AHC3_9BACL|nr:acetylornithine/succinylornithine family transaminase [Alicyclobacillus fastidiosus]WEH08154.1 acetylornithine/succinylornithine family transaminase [Alicyclobacillus fastidiosus]